MLGIGKVGNGFLREIGVMVGDGWSLIAVLKFLRKLWDDYRLRQGGSVYFWMVVALVKLFSN